MATAEAKTVTKTVTTEIEEPVVVLTLTEIETKTLALVTGFIGGSPDGSARGDMDSIAQALRVIGYRYNESPDYGLLSGTIDFENRSHSE